MTNTNPHFQDTPSSRSLPKVIFFGNGPLADFALSILEQNFDIIFHAKTKADLETVKTLKKQHPEAHGILASFGVLIKQDLLDLFEPEGILNIHPSLLPKYRGASPIESAILNGDKTFSVSIMKLAKAMDAGPIYYQETLTPDDTNRPDLKPYLYKTLAETGATWLAQNLKNLPKPTLQNDQNATFCSKLDKSMSLLTPETDSAEKTLRKIQAFQTFPKPKYQFFNKTCIILAAHLSTSIESPLLSLPCADGKVLSIDRLQPEGKSPMDAKSFLNGYAK